MTDCSKNLEFPFFEKLKLTANFKGGDISTDAGLLLVAQFERERNLIGGLSRAIFDPRNPQRVQHDQELLLRQRIYQIIAGYEDCNDATRLRMDPALKAAAGRSPSDPALGSQPTLSRLENRVDPEMCRDISSVMFDWWKQSRSAIPEAMTLDMDTSDFPTHGQQVLSFYNGHYDEHLYFPMFVTDADSGYLLASALRPGNQVSPFDATNMLDPIVSRLRNMRSALHLFFRADSHFATPVLLDWLEHHDISYVIGLPPNTVLEGMAAAFVSWVEQRYQTTKVPQREFTTFYYCTRRTWDHARRVIVKVEVGAQGTNVRFVVTNRGGYSVDLYDWYVQRGGTIESSIKELKNGFRGGRMSCHEFETNCFRLLLHTAAYNLMVLFRERIAVPELAHADIHTLRIRVIKVAARVRQTVRRLWFELSSSWPFASFYLAAHRSLVGASAPSG